MHVQITPFQLEETIHAKTVPDVQLVWLLLESVHHVMLALDLIMGHVKVVLLKPFQKETLALALIALDVLHVQQLLETVQDAMLVSVLTVLIVMPVLILPFQLEGLEFVKTVPDAQLVST